LQKFCLDLALAMPDLKQIRSNSSSTRRKDIKKAPWSDNQQMLQEVARLEEEYRILLLLRMTMAPMINKKIITRMFTGLSEFFSAPMLPLVHVLDLFDMVVNFFAAPYKCFGHLSSALLFKAFYL
jgi:hypothetical protein